MSYQNLYVEQKSKDSEISKTYIVENIIEISVETVYGQVWQISAITHFIHHIHISSSKTYFIVFELI